MNSKYNLLIKGLALLGIVGLLSSCGGSDGGGINLPVPDTSNCVDPSQCLTVTATWCPPGASTCATNDSISNSPAS